MLASPAHGAAHNRSTSGLPPLRQTPANVHTHKPIDPLRVALLVFNTSLRVIEASTGRSWGVNVFLLCVFVFVCDQVNVVGGGGRGGVLVVAVV